MNTVKRLQASHRWLVYCCLGSAVALLVLRPPSHWRPATTPSEPPYADSALAQAAVVDAGELQKWVVSAKTSSPAQSEQFLFPIYILEQETKAATHLHQLALVANALNRTLVLPRVGHGRLAHCLLHDFGTWYAPNALDKYGARSISDRDFEQLLRMRTVAERKGTLVKLISDASHVQLDIDSSKSFESLSTGEAFGMFCNKTTAAFGGLVDFPPTSVVTEYRVDAEHRNKSKGVAFERPASVGTDIIRHLIKHTSDVPILGIHYSFVANPFDDIQLSTPVHSDYTSRLSTFSRVDYSPHLHAIADEIVDMLGGSQALIAVNWRTERTKDSTIVSCGNDLITLLERHFTPDSTMTETPYKNWWFASDFPFENIFNPTANLKKPHSTTYRPTSEIRQAMWQFVDNLQQIPQIPQPVSLFMLNNLSTLNPTLQSKIRLLESGGRGIVEKLVSAKSSYFIAATNKGKKSCGYPSSFMHSIVQIREQSHDASLNNIVEYY